MSFTSTVKTELSKLKIEKVESFSLLSALIKNTSTIEDSSIKIMTENSSVARYIFSLLKDLYSIVPKITVRRGYNYNKRYIYILEIKEKIELIKQDLSLDKNIPNNYIVDDDILTRIYLRGVFLACGSINDPKKSRYHLEFIVDDLDYAVFITNMLNLYDLNSKYIKRESKYMIYIKEAEKIGDFLRMINAIQALLYFEDIRIYRDHKNMINRLNNCEQANVDKIIETAKNQVENIQFIKDNDVYDLLDEKLQMVCDYRLKYPEVSLSELSRIISKETNNNITKSGLHHRLNKIKELAEKIKNN